MDGHLIQQSECARKLLTATPQLADHQLRRLLFEYCKCYQENYWFVQLVNAFAFLDIVFDSGEYDPDDWNNELAAVKEEVEYAMEEYFVSLNEVATAVYRLLDNREISVHETIDALGHVWSAHSCQGPPSEFVEREDRILCELLVSIG